VSSPTTARILDAKRPGYFTFMSRLVLLELPISHAPRIIMAATKQGSSWPTIDGAEPFEPSRQAKTLVAEHLIKNMFVWYAHW